MSQPWGPPPPPSRPGSSAGPVVALAVAGLAVVLLVTAGIVALARGGDDDGGGTASGSTSRSAPPSSSPPSSPPAPADEYGVVVGPADAPRTVVLYEDFLCPPCGQLHARVGSRLRAQADAGTIRLVVRPVDFLERVDVYSSNAASALFVVRDAAGDEVAADFQGLLLDEQPPESGPYPSADDLVALAVRAGAEEDAVRAGIEGGDRRALVDEATQAAIDDARVPSVPYVLIDDEPVTNPGSGDDDLTRLLEELE